MRFLSSHPSHRAALAPMGFPHLFGMEARHGR